MDEIRNEILILKNIIKKDDNKTADKMIDYGMLLERFKIDLDRKKEDLQHEKEKVDRNIELLNDIVKDLNIKIW